mmetsp:Transcript_139255/g.338273  ORF Transcript_139255/g.338273 Transcript_139255/m.338273 type:complete len:241 (-) Transcript_139255:58-780(-)
MSLQQIAERALRLHVACAALRAGQPPRKFDTRRAGVGARAARALAAGTAASLDARNARRRTGVVSHHGARASRLGELGRQRRIAVPDDVGEGQAAKLQNDTAAPRDSRHHGAREGTCCTRSGVLALGAEPNHDRACRRQLSGKHLCRDLVHRGGGERQVSNATNHPNNSGVVCERHETSMSGFVLHVVRKCRAMLNLVHICGDTAVESSAKPLNAPVQRGTGVLGRSPRRRGHTDRANGE